MMTDGRIDWQATWVGGWLTEGLTDWLTDWLTDCLTSVLTGLQADWQTVWQARELFTPISLSLHSRFSTWRFDSIAYMKFKDGQLSWNSRLLFFTTGILKCKISVTSEFIYMKLQRNGWCSRRLITQRIPSAIQLVDGLLWGWGLGGSEKEGRSAAFRRS